MYVLYKNVYNLGRMQKVAIACGIFKAFCLNLYYF